MKTRLLFLAFAFMITLSTTAQVTPINTRLKLRVTPPATQNDTLLAIQADGTVVKTDKAVSDITSSGGGTSIEYWNDTSTYEIGDMVLSLDGDVINLYRNKVAGNTNNPIKVSGGLPDGLTEVPSSFGQPVSATPDVLYSRGTVLYVPNVQGFSKEGSLVIVNQDLTISSASFTDFVESIGNLTSAGGGGGGPVTYTDHTIVPVNSFAVDSSSDGFLIPILINSPMSGQIPSGYGGLLETTGLYASAFASEFILQMSSIPVSYLPYVNELGAATLLYSTAFDSYYSLSSAFEAVGSVIAVKTMTSGSSLNSEYWEWVSGSLTRDEIVALISSSSSTPILQQIFGAEGMNPVVVNQNSDIEFDLNSGRERIDFSFMNSNYYQSIDQITLSGGGSYAHINEGGIHLQGGSNSSSINVGDYGISLNFEGSLGTNKELLLTHDTPFSNSIHVPSWSNHSIRYLPLSVNGVLADSTGDIQIAAGGGNQSLQDVVEVDGFIHSDNNANNLHIDVSDAGTTFTIVGASESSSVGFNMSGTSTSSTLSQNHHKVFAESRSGNKIGVMSTEDGEVKLSRARASGGTGGKTELVFGEPGTGTSTLTIPGLSSANVTLPISVNGVGADSSGNIVVSGVSTGLEAIDEGNGIGWRLAGRNPANYGIIGLNSIDFSFYPTPSERGATGNFSFIGSGHGHIVTSDYSFIGGGYENIAAGVGSFVGGGENNEALGDYSVSIGGSSNIAQSYGEWVGGLYSTNYTAFSTTISSGTDRLFNIGNGTGSVRSDAFTILKNAQVGIDIDNFEANTTGEKFQVNGTGKFSGTLKIGEYTLPATDGVAGQVIQTNGLGVASWVTPSGGGGGSSGDMLKSVYDTNNNGIVDNSSLVNGLTVETAVPAGALFTDTVFTPSNLLTDYSFTDNSSNWDTAYGWGNHASAGYSTQTLTAGTNINIDGNNVISSTASIAWNEITGDQKDVNLMDFSDGIDSDWVVKMTPENNQWYSIATDGNGTWIGVAGSGTNRILKSIDNGVNWTVQATPENNNWKSIATDGNGTWIAVAVGFQSSSNRILKSVDNGITWTVQPNPDNNHWQSIATDRNGVWIASSSNQTTNKILKSIDNGATWTTQFPPGAGNFFSIATDEKGTWIAVGSMNGGLDNKILKSIDNGVNWTLEEVPEYNTYTSIATDKNGVWIAIASSGASSNRILKSIDNGISWTTQSTPVANNWKSIATDENGTWIAVGGTTGVDKIIHSNDNGATWTIEISPEANNYTSIATDGNGTWIGVSDNGINRILKLSPEIKFENIVNEYQVNGVKINPVNKVLNIPITSETGIQSIVAGTNITVDSTDPLNPIISSTGGSSTWGSITGTLSNQTDLNNALDGKENTFSKNTAFNKNFGTTSGTVAQGDDSRILNGQTAFGWGNHATEGYLKSVPAQTWNSITGKPTTIGGYGITDFNSLGDARWASTSHDHSGVYEPVFTKNTGFNKNYGTTSGTVAQGNDSRILNGQTAFDWGNHASAGYSTQTLTAGTNVTLNGNVIDVTIPTPTVPNLQSVATQGATTTTSLTATKFVDSNGTDASSGTVLTLDDNITGTIFNETPSSANSFTVANLKKGGWAVNYITTAGKTEFPTVDNAIGTETVTKSDPFRADATYKMVVSTDGTNIEYFFIDYLNNSPSGGDGVWGSITGTLSDQTDLQNVLNTFSTQTLTAGSNINISGNVISATDTNTTYTAGTGISIDGSNVISATGGGGGGSNVPLEAAVNGTGIVLAGRNNANYGVTGAYAFDISDSDEVSGFYGAYGVYSFAYGYKPAARGHRSFSGGYQTTSLGQNSVSLGSYTEANQDDSFALGRYVKSNGRSSVSLGNDMAAGSFAEIALGISGTTYSGNATSFNPVDRILNVGNGATPATPSDAFTILKNGQIGIGINNLETNSTGERLQVNGKVKANVVTTIGYTVSTLPAGNIGDRAYVTDATAPTYLGSLVGGGTVVCPVFHNGVEWVSH